MWPTISPFNGVNQSVGSVLERFLEEKEMGD
jgi:hypothetical protein